MQRMKKNQWVLLLGIVAGSRTMACDGGTVDEANSPQGMGGEGTGGGGTEEEPCASFAEAAGWLKGAPVSPTAESTPERVSAIGTKTWTLALKMLNAIPSSAHANLAHSATSAYAALGMASERYKDHDCGPAIEAALEFPESGMNLHHSIGAGLRELSSREIAESEDSDGLTISLTNSIWAIHSGMLPEPNELQSIYGATPNATSTTGEPARQLINCLIEEDSQGLLVDFLPPGYPDPDTFTADINVAYLAAPWSEKMSEGPVDFATSGGALEEVDGIRAYGVTRLMHEAETFTTIDLPLLGEKLSVMFVVPNDSFVGTLDDFSTTLTADMLEEARDGASPRYIDFEMPQVDIPPVTIDYLRPLGIICDPIDGLRQVFHGAAVEMDEDGIKAAAATVVFGDGDAAPEPPEEFFHIDRPFLFFVHDVETGLAVFSGRFNGPGL